MENIHRRILIIEDSESLVNVITSCFETFYTGFIFLNKEPVISTNEAVKAISENPCDIILLDHDLGSGNEGLEILEKISNKIKANEVRMLSTSISVITSKDLIKKYRQKGVEHFPGKNFLEIKKCLDDECKCHLL